MDDKKRFRRYLLFYFLLILAYVLFTLFSREEPVPLESGIRRYWVPSSTSTGTYENGLPPNQN